MGKIVQTPNTDCTSQISSCQIAIQDNVQLADEFCIIVSFVNSCVNEIYSFVTKKQEIVDYWKITRTSILLLLLLLITTWSKMYLKISYLCFIKCIYISVLAFVREQLSNAKRTFNQHCFSVECSKNVAIKCYSYIMKCSTFKNNDFIT